MYIFTMNINISNRQKTSCLLLSDALGSNKHQTRLRGVSYS